MEVSGKTEKLHLPIIIEMDEDEYYIVSCPLFRGCHSYGETKDEALENIREVIEQNALSIGSRCFPPLVPFAKEF